MEGKTLGVLFLPKACWQDAGRFAATLKATADSRNLAGASRQGFLAGRTLSSGAWPQQGARGKRDPQAKGDGTQGHPSSLALGQGSAPWMHVDLLWDPPPQVLSPARRFGGKRCEFGRGPSWLCPGNVAGQARGGGVRCPSVPWCDKSCAIGIAPSAPSLRAEQRMAPACANPACPHPARVSWDTGGSCPQGLWDMGRGRGSPEPTAGCTVASPPSRREGKQAPRNLVSSPTPLVTISMVMELRKPYCRAAPALSRAQARLGPGGQRLRSLGCSVFAPPGPAELPIMLQAATGVGENQGCLQATALPPLWHH